jgi:hypothetical protein
MLLLEPTRRSRLAVAIFPLIRLLPFTPMPALAASPAADPNSPLVVGGNSQLVVIEYEAWFGPNAVTFQGTAASPSSGRKTWYR